MSQNTWADVFEFPNIKIISTESNNTINYIYDPSQNLSLFSTISPMYIDGDKQTTLYNATLLIDINEIKAGTQFDIIVILKLSKSNRSDYHIKLAQEVKTDEFKLTYCTLIYNNTYIKPVQKTNYKQKLKVIQDQIDKSQLIFDFLNGIIHH